MSDFTLPKGETYTVEPIQAQDTEQNHVDKLARTDSEETIQARNEARRRNANTPIDFDNGLPQEAFEKRRDRSTWVSKIANLHKGVVKGHGEPDTYYRLGTFKSPTGARLIVKRFIDNPDTLPCDVALESRTHIGEDGKRHSELWGAIPSDTLDG